MPLEEVQRAVREALSNSAIYVRWIELNRAEGVPEEVLASPELAAAYAAALRRAVAPRAAEPAPERAPEAPAEGAGDA
jgi:hypothetical protein